jgi:hypothetical protein
VGKLLMQQLTTAYPNFDQRTRRTELTRQNKRYKGRHRPEGRGHLASETNGGRRL